MLSWPTAPTTSGPVPQSARNRKWLKRVCRRCSCLLLWCALRGLLNRTPEWQAWVYDNSLAAGVFRRRGNFNPRKAAAGRAPGGWGRHRLPSDQYVVSADRIAFGPLAAKARLQDIELAEISQRSPASVPRFRSSQTRVPRIDANFGIGPLRPELDICVLDDFRPARGIGAITAASSPGALPTGFAPCDASAVFTSGRLSPRSARNGSSFYSITSLAAACSVRGTARPNAFAVLRLITNSNWVGCRTGSSAGFAPLRICATYSPAWRYIQLMLGP
jgi:hypothetical protein